MKFNCYHGTSLENSNNIINDGFIAKPNIEHWLGDGVYFYIDYLLAEWWTTNPTDNFGEKIVNPAVIKCEINVDKDDVFDLRRLEDHQKFSNLYIDEFLGRFLPRYMSGEFEVPESFYPNYKKVRCAFCEYIRQTYKPKIIIGTFNGTSQPYLDERFKFGFEQFNLPFIETQVCIFDQSVIKKKEIMVDSPSKKKEEVLL